MNKDKIKAVLDQDCKDNGLCHKPKRSVNRGDGLPTYHFLECWECHRNDELTDKIIASEG